MKLDEFMGKRRNLAGRFENTCQRLLAGEKFDPYNEDLSFMFEVIAAELFADVPERKLCWYDGVDGLTSSVRKSRQVEFEGEMWVGDGKTQWKENFRARITDKRVTKQGIWITIWISSDRAEAELLSAFGVTEEM